MFSASLIELREKKLFFQTDGFSPTFLSDDKIRQGVLPCFILVHYVKKKTYHDAEQTENEVKYTLTATAEYRLLLCAHCAALTFEETLICSVWKYVYTETKPGRKHKNINTGCFEGIIVLASYMTNII